jgi:hypothetical protein
MYIISRYFYTTEIYNIYAFEMSQYDFWMKF